MRRPLPANENVVDTEETSEIRAAIIGPLLERASRSYSAEGSSDMWGFTLDAMVYLSQWLSLAQPELTRDFFLALAELAVAQNEPELCIANAKVIGTQIALLKALRARMAS